MSLGPCRRAYVPFTGGYRAARSGIRRAGSACGQVSVRRTLRTMTGTDLAALRRLAEDGNEEAADRLAVLAAERGDVEELKHLIDAGNEMAADRLAELAGGRGDVDTLNRLVDEGSEVAATQLSRIISETAYVGRRGAGLQDRPRCRSRAAVEPN